MKQSYKNMRDFWLDVKNLENRKGVLEVGPDKISVAGVEMAVPDGDSVKYLFLATNSLGDSSLYFENNSKSGIGGGSRGNRPHPAPNNAPPPPAPPSQHNGPKTAPGAPGGAAPPSFPGIGTPFGRSPRQNGSH